MKTNQRLKLFLKAKGITQEYMANRVGMKHKAFNAMLNGHAELRADTLEKVFNVLGIPPADFYALKVQESESILKNKENNTCKKASSTDCAT